MFCSVSDLLSNLSVKTVVICQQQPNGSHGLYVCLLCFLVSPCGRLLTDCCGCFVYQALSTYSRLWPTRCAWRFVAQFNCVLQLVIQINGLPFVARLGGRKGVECLHAINKDVYSRAGYIWTVWNETLSRVINVNIARSTPQNWVPSKQSKTSTLQFHVANHLQ